MLSSYMLITLSTCICFRDYLIVLIIPTSSWRTIMSQLFLGHWHQMQLPSTHHVKGTVETTGKNRSKEMSLFHSS